MLQTLLGWTSEEHLCLFRLCFEGDNILPPKLLTTKHLPGTSSNFEKLLKHILQINSTH